MSVPEQRPGTPAAGLAYQEAREAVLAYAAQARIDLEDSHGDLTVRRAVSVFVVGWLFGLPRSLTDAELAAATRGARDAYREVTR